MDYSHDQEYLNMTVRCILCRGTIIYKDGDMTRFTAHLANEHGAFFDVEYLLASCFMDENQRDAISQSIRTQSPPSGLQTLPPPSDMQTFDPSEMDPSPAPVMETDQTNNEAGDFSISMKQAISQSGRVSCDLCPKSYTRNEGLKKHILKAHSASAPTDDTAEKNKEELEEAEQSLSESIEESFSSTAEEAEQSFNAAADNLLNELDKELEELDKDAVNMEENEEATIKTEDAVDDGEKTEKKWECKMCGKTYKSNQGLAYHMKKICTGKPMEDNTELGNVEKVPVKRAEDNLNDVLLAEGIDLSKSAYFAKTKQGLTMAAISSIEKFTETLPFLPDGWKFRTTEQKDKGKVVIHKHYLSPANVLVKASIAVVEYLRLEGKLNPEEILDVAKSLKVGPVKLKKLFANDASDISVNDETIAEAAA